jgi:hypothetical protein
MFNPHLQRLHPRRNKHLLFLRQHVFQNPFINRLFDDLENAVFHNGTGCYRASPRIHDFSDKAVGAKGARDAVCNSVDERGADEGEGGEEDSVAVAYVGESHGVVVAPGA